MGMINEKPRITATFCPSCGHYLDSVACATDPNITQPTPGDFTLCMNCATILKFADDLRPQEIAAQDLSELNEQDLQILQHARTALITLNPLNSSCMPKE